VSFTLAFTTSRGVSKQFCVKVVALDGGYIHEFPMKFAAKVIVATETAQPAAEYSQTWLGK